MLIDTHAHLDFPDFSGDTEAVVARAREAGVTRIVTIGTDLESSRDAVNLAERFPEVYAVIGIHPNSAIEAGPNDIGALRELARHPKVAAIGETGLDYYRLPSSRLTRTSIAALGNEDPADVEGAIEDGEVKSAQAAIFTAQLDLAMELGQNVVIHQRGECREETRALIAPYTGKLRAVFHCFTGTLEEAAEWIALGHLVSFTGIVTFKSAEIVHQTAAGVPGGSFMVETDAPFLAPVPFRGKRCEPAHTRLIAERLAELRGVSLEAIAKETSAVAEAFFRLSR